MSKFTFILKDINTSFSEISRAGKKNPQRYRRSKKYYQPTLDLIEIYRILYSITT
jgi:hypothetical protein